MEEKFTKMDIDIMNGYIPKYVISSEIVFILLMIFISFFINISLTSYFKVETITHFAEIVIIIFCSFSTSIFKKAITSVDLNTMTIYKRMNIDEDLSVFGNTLMIKIFYYISFDFILVQRLTDYLDTLEILTVVILMLLIQLFIRLNRTSKMILSSVSVSILMFFYKFIRGIFNLDLILFTTDYEEEDFR